MADEFSEKERKDGNTKILNYVGYRYYGENEYFISPTKNEDTIIHLNDVKYDYSWDWLMPLYKNIVRSIDIKKKNVSKPGILLLKFYELKYSISSDFPIESSWKKLIEFIDLYNEIKIN